MIRSTVKKLSVLAVAFALTACADNGVAPTLPGQADTGGYDAVIDGSPVADASAIAPGSWADKIKQRGTSPATRSW